MKRIVKYILLLLSIVVSLSTFSQQRSIVNTETVTRSVVVMDSISNKNTGDIWEQLEQERIAAEKAEQERIAAEKVEQERLAAEKKAERVRLASEKKAEQKRFAAEKRETAKQKYQNYLQNAKIKTLILGELGCSAAPQVSGGIMIGQMYKGIGWFVSGRSNGNFEAPSKYTCDANGSIDGVIPFYRGKHNTMHRLINAGIMVNFIERLTTNKFNTFGMYLGAGYGRREYQLYTHNPSSVAMILSGDGVIVKYAPTSPNGVSGTVGFFGSIYGLTLNVGVSTIAFKNMELEVGIGYMF